MGIRSFFASRKGTVVSDYEKQKAKEGRAYEKMMAKKYAKERKADEKAWKAQRKLV